LEQGIKNLEIFKNEKEIQDLVLSIKWYKSYLKNYDFRYGRLRGNKKNVPLKARALTTTKLFWPAEYRKRT
jgi:hypothetical protein